MLKWAVLTKISMSALLARNITNSFNKFMLACFPEHAHYRPKVPKVQAGTMILLDCWPTWYLVANLNMAWQVACQVKIRS